MKTGVPFTVFFVFSAKKLRPGMLVNFTTESAVCIRPAASGNKLCVFSRRHHARETGNNRDRSQQINIIYCNGRRRKESN
jgi:hypothetical protein